MLEPLQGGIHSADGNVAPGAGFDLAPHDHSVRTAVQAQQCEQDEVFKRPEKFASLHLFYNIKQIPAGLSRDTPGWVRADPFPEAARAPRICHATCAVSGAAFNCR